MKFGFFILHQNQRRILAPPQKKSHPPPRRLEQISPHLDKVFDAFA